MTFGKNWVIFWYFGALGFEMQRYVFGTVLFYHIWTTPQTVCNLLKEGGKKKSWEVFFPQTIHPFCQSLLPDLYLWLRCPQSRSRQDGRGGNMREVVFFFRRSVLPLALVGEIWTHINHGKLVFQKKFFQKKLKEEFILIPKIHPWTCHTISTRYAE